MMNKKASVAKVVALAVVPLILAVVVANVAQQRRANGAEVATKQLLDSVDFQVGKFELKTSELRVLIAQGANVNVHTRDGSTPLHYAASLNSGSIQVLLDNGANINARTDAGGTPLMYAVLARDVEGVRLLLRNSADVNLPVRADSGEEYTPLSQAQLLLRSDAGSPIYGPRLREIIQLLKAAGAKE